MADTIPGVTWHLERECPFRKGVAVTALAPALDATRPLRFIDSASLSGDIYGDICVSGTSFFRDRKAPSSGLRISQAVAPGGDLEGAREICRQCPANTLRAADAMAGCWGRISIEPGDKWWNSHLEETIRARDLDSAFADSFVRTNPLWYGFWITSPLSRPQLEILRTLFSHASTHLDPKAIASFSTACAVALEHNLALHVAMSPPGHTDFSFYTVFPHCPRCKLGNGERWNQPYSTRLTLCSACGHSYVPADTASSTQDSSIDDMELERLLTPAEYQSLCAQWLERHAHETPTHLELLISGKLRTAHGLQKDAMPHRKPSRLALLWRRLFGSGT